MSKEFACYDENGNISDWDLHNDILSETEHLYTKDEILEYSFNHDFSYVKAHFIPKLTMKEWLANKYDENNSAHRELKEQHDEDNK